VTPDIPTLLDAHVRFELQRWSTETRAEALREELEALLDWVCAQPVTALLPADAPGRVAALVSELPVTDEMVAIVAEGAAAAREAVVTSELTFADLASSEQVEEMVAVLASWQEPRRRAVAAVTSSDAYTKLVAHVLYHGLKAYVLTENVIARRVPGASSLMRLGQRGLSSAVPTLEANVDRQLTAFVQANIADTLRESERYLDRTLDPETLMRMGQDAWRAVRERPVAALAEPWEADDLDAVVVAAGPLVRSVLASGLPSAVAEQVVARLRDVHGDRPVGDLLADCGVEVDVLADALAEALTPAVALAYESGFAEARIRAHLEPFYAALPALLPER
jgi:hypothetical protein